MKLGRRTESWVLAGALGVVLVLLWEGAVVWSHTTVFPSPYATLRAVYQLAADGRLVRYSEASIVRIAIGFTIAAVLGVPLGLAMGWYRGWSTAIDPVIQTLRPISPIAWIPVTLILFGVADAAPVFIVFLGCFFPIVTVTTNAVRGIPPILLQVGRNFGLAPAALFGRVILPAALPQILTGLRLALGIGWLVLVAAEMIAVNSGLGYLVLDARNAGQRYDLVVAGMLLIGLIGLTLDALLRRVEALRSLRWGFRAK